MKRVVALAAFIAMIGASSAFASESKPAEPPVEPPKEKPKDVPKERERRRHAAGGESARILGQFFRELDKNGDQKLSKEEFDNDKLFDELDADKDSAVTFAECAKATDKIGEEVKRRTKAAAEEEFKALDRNDDKKLSEEELGDRKGLMEGDKNGDKSLDLEEYIAASAAAKAAKAKEAADKMRDAANKTPEEVFKEMDKDGDGKLAGDEINERLKKAIEASGADTDKDGSLSLDEYKAFREKMAEKHKERRPNDRRRRGDQPKEPEKKPDPKEKEENF